MGSYERNLVFLEVYYGKNHNFQGKELCLEKHMIILWPCNNLEVWKIHERSFYWITGIFMPVFGFLGLILNLVIAFVFLRMRRTKATTAFVVALAFCDVGVLLVGGIMNIFRAGVHYTSEKVVKSYTLMVINVYFIASSLVMFQCLTVNIMVSLSIFRYLAIKFPLKAYKICSRLRAFVAVFTSICLTVLLTGSQFNNFGIKKNCGQNCKSVVYQLSLRIGKFWLDFQYYLILAKVNFIPWLILVISSVLLMIEIRKSANVIVKIGKSLNENVNRKRMVEKRISRMILLIIAMTSFLYLPQVVYMIINLINSKLASYHPYLLIFSYISNGLVVVNSGINFFLYLAVNNQFRQDIVAVFCCANKRRQQTSVRSTKTQSTSIANIVIKT